MSYEYSENNWLESWIAEGHPIESSEYYAEKLDIEPPTTVSAVHVRAPRRKRTAYITNREHKNRLVRNFVVYRTSHDSHFVIYKHSCAPYFLMPSRKCRSVYGHGNHLYCWDSINTMLCLEGRILPSMVYVTRANNPLYSISQKFKREVKRVSNRRVRYYRGEISRGRHAHRLTARYYDIQLF